MAVSSSLLSLLTAAGAAGVLPGLALGPGPAVSRQHDDSQSVQFNSHLLILSISGTMSPLYTLTSARSSSLVP